MEEGKRLSLPRKETSTQAEGSALLQHGLATQGGRFFGRLLLLIVMGPTCQRGSINQMSFRNLLAAVLLAEWLMHPLFWNLGNVTCLTWLKHTSEEANDLRKEVELSLELD